MSATATGHFLPPFPDSKIVMNDDNGHLVRTVTLMGRIGATRNAVMWFSMLLAFRAVRAVRRADAHLQNRRGCARSSPACRDPTSGITLRDSTERFAANASNKFLVLVGVGAAMEGLVSNGTTLIQSIHDQRPRRAIDVAAVAGTAALVLVVAYYGYIAFLKVRLRQSAI